MIFLTLFFLILFLNSSLFLIYIYYIYKSVDVYFFTNSIFSKRVLGRIMPKTVSTQ